MSDRCFHTLSSSPSLGSQDRALKCIHCLLIYNVQACPLSLVTRSLTASCLLYNVCNHFVWNTLFHSQECGVRGSPKWVLGSWKDEAFLGRAWQWLFGVSVVSPKRALNSIQWPQPLLYVCQSAFYYWPRAWSQVPEQKSSVLPSRSFIVAIKHLLNTLCRAKAGWSGLWRVRARLVVTIPWVPCAQVEKSWWIVHPEVTRRGRQQSPWGQLLELWQAAGWSEYISWRGTGAPWWGEISMAAVRKIFTTAILFWHPCGLKDSAHTLDWASNDPPSMSPCCHLIGEPWANVEKDNHTSPSMTLGLSRTSHRLLIVRCLVRLGSSFS
jgi:hypothetical protein